MKVILAEAPRKLNRKEIHRSWRIAPKPDMRSMFNWLERAFALALVTRDGEGRRRRPFRYWLAERECVWLAGSFRVAAHAGAGGGIYDGLLDDGWGSDGSRLRA